MDKVFTGHENLIMKQREVILVCEMKDKHEKVTESVVPELFKCMAEQVLEAVFVFDVSGKVLYANYAAAAMYGYAPETFRNICFYDLYLSKDQQSMADQIKENQQMGLLQEAVHRRCNGETFSVKTGFYKTVFGKETVLISLVQKLAEKKKESLMDNEKKYKVLHEELLAAYEELTASEEELRQQFDELLVKEGKIYRQNTVLGLLHDTAVGLMMDTDHNGVFKKIIYGIRNLFNTSHSFVYVVNEEKMIYTLEAGTGVFSKLPCEGVLIEGIIGQTYRTGEMVIVDNYSEWTHRLADPLFDEVHYFAVVPLKNKNEMIGVIGIAFSEIKRVLSGDELSLLKQFADLAAMALRNALLVGSLYNEIKERRQAEKEQKQSEEKFFKSFQMSPSAVAIAQMDGMYTDVNESFCKSTGYTKDELVNRTRNQVGLWLHAQDRDFLLDELKKHGEVNNLEVWFQRKDGRKCCGLMSARIITINGNPCIISITNDITELKKIEEKLKASEEKFSQAFYLSPDIITITQVDGTYVDVNEGFVRISGFSKEETIGKKSIELGFWHDQSARERMLDLQKNYGEIRNMEVPFRCKDGHVIYGQLSACMLTIEGESCYMVVVRDITDRVRSEENRRRQEEILAASKKKLSLAAGLANIAPWEYNTKTELFEFDDEFYAIYATDVTREGHFMSVDKYIKEFVHPEDAWMFKNEKDFLASKEQIKISDLGHRIIRRDGVVRNVLVRRSVIRDAVGKTIKAYGTNQDVTDMVKVEEERRKQAETIRHMAYFDSLTGLANRRHLNEWFNKEMEQARCGKAFGVILFIDLDDLKMVNDTYGHSYGDKIICTAGERIVEGVGEKAFVSRIGGDEFVVILSGMHDRAKIEEIAKKISKLLGKKREILGRRFHMTASIGIASYAADGDTAEELIKNADNAMYAVKKDNKNAWRFYNEGMQAAAYKTIRLTSSLRYALERKELSIVYQPQICTTRKTVIGFEALLRWNSSEYGIVSPMQFIPLAEQSGYIHSIGQWVLRESCQFARRLADQGWQEIRVAVNISSKQLATDNFIAMVRSAVQDAGIEPQQLELEITESLLIKSMEDATDKLMKLKKFGVQLSLDDFGTGFSSLTYLRRLPVKTLKIDKSFIDMITTDVQGAKIIGSIINMAHTINMKVVAEGVETQEQLEYLTDNACDLIQGYLFSRPVAEMEAVKLLLDQLGETKG